MSVGYKPLPSDETPRPPQGGSGTYTGPFGMVDPGYHARVIAAADKIAALLEARWHGEHVSRDDLKRAVYYYRDTVAGGVKGERREAT